MKRNKTDKSELENGVSRRDFLRGAGAAAVSGGILATPGLLHAAEDQPGAVLGPGAVKFTLEINGKPHPVELEPRVTLLDALRNTLDLTGSKRVCDRGTCGACTVHLDGKPVYSCSVLAIEAEGRKITTIEGLAAEGQLTPIMEAFVDHDAQQCGFCTPGFVMAATAFLKEHPNPTLGQAEHALSGNLCRCGTYRGQKEAMMQAAHRMKAATEV